MDHGSSAAHRWRCTVIASPLVRHRLGWNRPDNKTRSKGIQSSQVLAKQQSDAFLFCLVSRMESAERGRPPPGCLRGL